MKFSIIALQVFLYFLTMFDFQQSSTINRLPYMHSIDEQRVVVHLEDYVSPEFVEYYFYRFGYDIEKVNIHPVQGIITNTISEQDMKRLSAHPFVQDITVQSYDYMIPFVGPVTLSSLIQTSLLPQKKITFHYYVTDEMMEAFLFQNKNLGIELLPRAPKSVTLKPTKFPSRMMAELDMLIYVKDSYGVNE